ncbi:MAG TPA: hypothetical protein VG735_09900 [Caulobacterales bacterium]|nr:hypothetical protein [Caulobacterales bacterium]
MNGERLGFDPSMPWPMLFALAGFAALMWIGYVLRRGRAPILRAIGLTLLTIAIAQPMLVRETREPANDVAALIIDQSESLKLAGRLEAARRAGAALAQKLSKEKGLDVRVREVRGGPEGTALIAAMDEALADAPRDRIAGALLVTDGQVSDVPADIATARKLGPVHALIVGDPNRGDRRLELISAPGFGIVNEPVNVEARVIEPKPGGPVRITVSIDGKPIREIIVESGKPFKLTIAPPKRGPNMVIIEAEAGPQEISRTNNRAAFELQGVRDRLRVLLVTGSPYPGARVWRNLLKSDPSVDLVHFTILRPADKLDLTPQNELALIAFPTRELFEEKIDQFDLIIFDRYRRAGMLPLAYFENIAQRVEAGGAMLIAAGPEEASEDSLSRTPIAAILPSQPNGSVIEQPFRPTLTATGQRHPVTRGLPSPQSWGRWNRQVVANASGGRTLLAGAGGAPLLVLDRAGQGRVAQLWSDQAWLWARGYDGGGPHGELLRRLGHWLMQEPELEEERLTAKSTPDGLVVERSTLGDNAGDVEVTAPSGAKVKQTLQAFAPGVWRTTLQTTETGLYEAQSGTLQAFAAVGPLNPKEAAAVAATATILEPLARASGGGVTILGESGAPVPEIRRVDRNGGAHGDGWIGLKRNNAYVVRASASEPLGPGWAWAMAGLAVLMLGWRREAG